VHHLISIIGCCYSIKVGGFIGSISQLSFLTELSTSFVNIRALIPKNSILYILNGFCMVVSFTVFRIFWYNFVIFDQFQMYIMYRGFHFWQLYDKADHFGVQVLIWFAMILFGLNLFWYSKMVSGLL